MEKYEKIRNERFNKIRVFVYLLLSVALCFVVVKFLMQPSHPCVYQRNLKIEDDFTILTAANEIYFEELKNLVGSIHYWEPMRRYKFRVHKLNGIRIVIYNLGLASTHVNEINSWCNVVLRDFNFDNHPPHVQNLQNFAFLPLIINENLSRGSVLWLSSGTELRRSISNILQKRLASTGHWTSTSKNSLCHFTGENVFNCFNTTRVKYKCEDPSRVLMDSTHIAVKKNSVFHLNILPEVVNLVLREECLVPPSFEQSIFSMSMVDFFNLS